MDKGKRGALVVVEGLDRAGKSSQCELLYKSLLELNYKAKYIRFPGKKSKFLIMAGGRTLREQNSDLDRQTEPPPLESRLIAICKASRS